MEAEGDGGGKPELVNPNAVSACSGVPPPRRFRDPKVDTAAGFGVRRKSGHGLARVLSKLGFCSRAEAFRLIQAGRVTLNGQLCRDPERRTQVGKDEVAVDGCPVKQASGIYLMLNKPRGLITTAEDDRGRATVFQCLGDLGEVPRVFPVGRLDRASEGLLLFTNDTAWAARLTDAGVGVEKTYRVQVAARVVEGDGRGWEEGISVGGEILRVKRVGVLRAGGRNTWLEVVLTEGKNRHIRRLCEAMGWEVLRLIRVRLGNLELGELAKGAYRRLTRAEVEGLARWEHVGNGRGER